jgi:hypothetical protein
MTVRDALSSRERILRALARDGVDRVPVTPFGLGRLNPDDAFTQEFIRATDPFLAVGMGGNVFAGRLFAEHVQTVAEGPDGVTWKIATPHGVLTRRYRRTHVTGYTVEFPCKTADDLLAYLSIPFEPSEPDARHFHAWRATYGDQGLVIAGVPNAVCFPAEVLSPEDFSMLWADEPDVMCSVVNRAQERLLDFTEKACRKGVDVFRIIGAEYVTEQLGPAAFTALCAEQDRALVALIHRHGGLAYYHCHGDVREHLDAFAALGIDALDPLEVPPYGDVDLGDAQRRIGDRVCLVGGLDDMEVLETRDADTVRSMGRQCLEAAGARGYCLGGTASGIYTERAARNFMALVDVARQFGG